MKKRHATRAKWGVEGDSKDGGSGRVESGERKFGVGLALRWIDDEEGIQIPSS